MSDVHAEVQSLMAAYAIGAVPADEVPALRAHILSCETCFTEAESYAEALAALAFASTPEPLPPGFADRVVAAALSETPAGQQEPAAAKRGWFARWTPALGFAAAALAILLVATSIALVNVLGDRERYESIVAAMVHDRDALELQGAGGAEGVVVSTEEGTVLITASLGEAPQGRDYQLWLMKDGVPTPAETFDAEEGVAIVHSRHPLEGFDGAAVTVEPEGGSTQPTTDPVLATG